MTELKYPKFWSRKSWISLALLPFSYVYILLGLVRLRITPGVRLSQKVICIGNITVGGAGKTQLALWLAKALAKKNISFVIVTKAYRSTLVGAKLVQKTDRAEEVGDESVLLAKAGPVIATKNIRDSLALISQLNPEAVILDDGMQNPFLKKDLHILAFDTISGIGNNLHFPAGPLRESVAAGLAKADLVFTVGDNKYLAPKLREKIQLSRKPYFRTEIKLKKQLDKKPCYIAFAGIGNPEKFFLLLAGNNFRIQKCISFGDHHHYSENDLKKLTDLAKAHNCRLITTEKDYVKIPGRYKKLVTCASVRLEPENEQECLNLIYEKLWPKQPR